MTIVAHVEARDLIKYADPKYYWRYDNKTVQRLIAAGDAAQTNAQSNADYREVERIITQAAVNDWLFLLPSLEVVRTGITGYPRNSLSLSFDITALRREVTPWGPCSASRSSTTSSARYARRRRAAGLRLPAARRRRPPGAADPPAVRQDGGQHRLRLLAPVVVRAAGLRRGRAGHARALHAPTASSRPSSTRPRTATTRSSGRRVYPAATGASACTASPIRVWSAAGGGRAAAPSSRSALPSPVRRRTRAGPRTRALPLAFAAPWGAFLALDSARRAGDEDGLTQLLGGARRRQRPVLGAAVRRLAAGARAPRAVLQRVARPSDLRRLLEALQRRRVRPRARAGAAHRRLVRRVPERARAELRRAEPPSRPPQKLVIGPWFHIDWAPVDWPGNPDDGPPAGGPSTRWQLRWFDRFLKEDEETPTGSPSASTSSARAGASRRLAAEHRAGATALPALGRQCELGTGRRRALLRAAGRRASRRLHLRPAGRRAARRRPLLCVPSAARIGPACQCAAETAKTMLVYTAPRSSARSP